MARAVPEGYTLLIDTSSLWLGSLMQSTSYDPERDFAPIALLARSTNVLVVHPSAPVKSTKELIALAKSKPGALNYGTSSTGGTPHLAAELFKALAAVNIVRVPYKGGAAAAAGVVGGEVQVYFGGGTAVGRFHKSGQLRALAVTSAAPSALFPDLPTVAATVPGYEAVGLSGIFAPAKTPTPIIKRLNQEIVRFLKTADAKEKYLSSGAEAVGSSPEELAVTIKSNMALWGKVIKDAGIKVQ